MSNGYKLNKIYSVGYCRGRGRFADRTLSYEQRRFFTRCFLLEHPTKGLILVDTGYGKALIDIVQKGIYSLYNKLLPFTYAEKDSIVWQLHLDGISLKDISYLIITHFHPDHIGALPEFTDVAWIYREDSLHYLRNLSIFKALQKGFIRSLVPRVPKKSIPINQDNFNIKWHEFQAHDLFGDHSLFLVNLPGHATGQMGVFIQDTFIVADATWGGKALPSQVGLLLQDSPKEYQNTYEAIQRLDNSIQIYPTHTIEAYE